MLIVLMSLFQGWGQSPLTIRFDLPLGRVLTTQYRAEASANNKIVKNKISTNVSGRRLSEAILRPTIIESVRSIRQQKRSQNAGQNN